MTIKLPKTTTDELLDSIKKYFREELDEDVGDLRSQMLLDFILAEVAPSVYNKAIADAQAFFQEKALDLDGSCFEPEMTYWKPEPKR